MGDCSPDSEASRYVEPTPKGKGVNGRTRVPGISDAAYQQTRDELPAVGAGCTNECAGLKGCARAQLGAPEGLPGAAGGASNVKPCEGPVPQSGVHATSPGIPASEHDDHVLSVGTSVGVAGARSRGDRSGTPPSWESGTGEGATETWTSPLPLLFGGHS